MLHQCATGAWDSGWVQRWPCCFWTASQNQAACHSAGEMSSPSERLILTTLTQHTVTMPPSLSRLKHGLVCPSLWPAYTAITLVHYACLTSPLIWAQLITYTWQMWSFKPQRCNCVNVTGRLGSVTVSDLLRLQRGLHAVPYSLQLIKPSPFSMSDP